MRTVQISAYGPPDVLKVVEVPSPPLERATDVRVRVVATTINPIDWKVRAGLQRGVIRLSLPWTWGLDVSGEVVEVGGGVTRFAVGDLVYGCPDWRRPGAYAEEVLIDEGLLANAPTTVDLAHAAALPLVGLTAWQCLLPRLTESPGQRVFIQAGSGGVGSIAIQIAKHHGAWVATTCSERNHELVRRLGADEVIDYRTANWWEELSDLDVVLDALGYEERDLALAAVKKGGRVASIVSGLPHNTEAYGPNLGAVATGLGVAAFWIKGKLRCRDASTVVKQTRADQLEAMAALVDEGVLEPVIDKSFPLDELAEAHAYGETGRIRGKVLIRP